MHPRPARTIWRRECSTGIARDSEEDAVQRTGHVTRCHGGVYRSVHVEVQRRVDLFDDVRPDAVVIEITVIDREDNPAWFDSSSEAVPFGATHEECRPGERHVDKRPCLRDRCGIPPRPYLL